MKTKETKETKQKETKETKEIVQAYKFQKKFKKQCQKIFAQKKGEFLMSTNSKNSSKRNEKIYKRLQYTNRRKMTTLLYAFHEAFMLNKFRSQNPRNIWHKAVS